MPDENKVISKSEKIKNIFSEKPKGTPIISYGKQLDYKKNIPDLYDEFGVDFTPGKWEEGIEGARRQAAYDEAKIKADEQGALGAFANMAVQLTAGEVGLGALAGLGYMLDLEFVYDKLTGNEADYGNWFSDLAEKGKEYISEDLAPNEFPGPFISM